jgi:hypothetical protein
MHIKLIFKAKMTNFTLIAAYLLNNAINGTTPSFKGENSSWAPTFAATIGIGAIILICCIISCAKRR